MDVTHTSTHPHTHTPTDPLPPRALQSFAAPLDGRKRFAHHRFKVRQNIAGIIVCAFPDLARFSLRAPNDLVRMARRHKDDLVLLDHPRGLFPRPLDYPL